ncbi:uncharacterized protein BDV17DRAFT_291871 [Aspergillus undulatus]|uniref:uncharacterized protein n=1 Tax=Aspergillus undulatus TaxID=1810928 RepID=UPI003CCCA179
MLTEYERVVAVWRISRNQMVLKQPKIVPSRIKEAFLRPRQWLLYLMAICYGILNGGVANFLAAIIKGFGYSPLRTSLLQTPVGGIQVAMVIAFGCLRKVPNMLDATVVISCIPGLAGLVRLRKILMMRRTGLRLIYCAGIIAGPHLFLSSEVPRYETAIKGLAGSYTAAMGLQLIYTGYCWFENRRKEREGLLVGADSVEAALESFEHLTDEQNRQFSVSDLKD